LKQVGFGFWAALLFLCATVLQGAEKPPFEQANRLYEEGDYRGAVDAFRALAEGGQVSAAVLFNLGNAYFKAGDKGRAVYCYRWARELAPRDPDIRANLRFVRNSVYGGRWRDPHPLRGWVERAGLNEWTWITVIAFWSWGGLMVVRNLSRRWRQRTRLLVRALGLLVIVLAGATGWRAYARATDRTAIIVVPEAVVRYGPLDASESHYVVRDGVELRALDRKDGWIQVRDSDERIGWVEDQAVWRFPGKGPTFTF